MLRLLLSIFLAALITLSLFLLMQALIKSADQELSEPPVGSVLDFVRLKQEEAAQTKDRKPRKPPPPKAPPPQMEQPQMEAANPNTATSGMDFGADVTADLALDGGLALDSGDGEYLPIVRVAAVYPRRALQRGIEGYVDLEFTVTKQGSVRDPKVVAASPEGIFEQAAMDAALKYKYKPRVVNGDAAEVSGVEVRVTFEIGG
ncbi:MAG: energy transducer TonB [Paraglaciecola sp.]|uniref:energy transducer TonB n=1 Tax=Pseudomonadati TaxID=3379134 RepID=UPI00273E03C9|nr:energy transducer TonB [Paraglaciecola sp.]MDP5028881.1 energy transducer TonB [Paraglaciecola sp.]MDP5129758.1 energy transducer TonB [Paraglaciecola sp.]